MEDVEATGLSYVEDEWYYARGPWTTLDPYPFPPSGVCSKTPAELDLFKIDESIRQCFQEASTVEEFLHAQRRIDQAQDEVQEAYIFSQFILFLRLCDPNSLEHAISCIQKWMQNTPVDNEDRHRRLQIHELLRRRFHDLRLSACFSKINKYHPDGSATPAKSEYTKLSHQHRELALYHRPPHPDIDRNPFWYMSAAMEQFDRSPKSTIWTVQLVIAKMERIEEDSGHLVWIRVLEELSQELKAHYSLGGSEEVFSAAVRQWHMLAQKWPDSPSKQAGYLADLVDIYQLRFLRIGSLGDLDIAIEKAKDLVKLEEHPKSLFFRSNLGRLYGRRFLRNQKRHRCDIDQGTRETRAAVDQIQGIANETSRPKFEPELYRNYAWLLYLSFLEDRSPAALDDSILSYEQAIQAMPRKWGTQWSLHHVGFLEQAPYQMELGTALTMRFISRTPGIEDDIIKALKALKLANYLSTSIPTEDQRVEVLIALQSASLAEWAQRVSPSAQRTFELAKQLASYSNEGWECVGAGLNARIAMAQFGGELWATIGIDDKALTLCEAAARMLPALSNWSAVMADRQYILANHSRLSSLAASLALRIGREHFQALSLLEMGRGIISGQILDIRTDLLQLEQKLPDLASDFEALRRELDKSAKISARVQGESFGMPGTLETEAQSQRANEYRFNKLLENIRVNNGFENFLLWPSEDEMIEVAEHGPIVVLSTSSLRTDAFIIQPNGIRALELKDVSDVEIEEMGWEMKRYAASPTFDINPLLCRIWYTIAKPVVEALGFNKPVVDDRWPRMWWILAGDFSHLPLHAAGDHQLGSGESVIDRVISSYAPTVKALVHWRRQKPSPRRSRGAHRALLVGMPDTPCQKPLPAVKEEVLMLRKLWPSLGLEIEPLSRVHKEEVMHHLKLCKIFHFAGHGDADQIDPSCSQLLLEDWQHNALTVSDLRDSRLQDNNPFLAFLSACSTGANEVDNLVNEGIHLAGALQLAGFRHVICTMWEVSDSPCVDVARVFYETLLANGMTDEAVALGLHKSIRKLRRTYLESMPAEKAFVPSLPKTEKKVRSKEEVVDDFLRSAHQTHLAVKKSRIGGIQVLQSSRSSRRPLSCTVGPVKGPSVQRVHWIPYIHFGV